MKRTRPSVRTAKLKQELRRIKRENRDLRRALSNSPVSPSLYSERAPGHAAERFGAHSESFAFYRKKTFFRYLSAMLRTSLIFGLWKRIYTYFRRYRLAILSAEIFLFIVTFLQSGAVFLVLSAISAVLLPTLFLTLAVLSQFTAFRKRGEIRRVEAAVRAAEALYVFPLPRKGFSRGNRGFPALLHSLTEADRHSVVLIVSPYLVSKKAILPISDASRPRYYAAAREEAPNIFLLRGHFFFGIRRSLASLGEKQLTVFY